MYLSRSDVLRRRAGNLRRQATRSPIHLAAAYRRRAAELEVLAAVTGPWWSPDAEPVGAAAA
jgi:hypothetical protein